VLTTVLAFLAERRGVDLRRSRHDEVARAITRARGSTFLVLGEEQVPLAGRLTDVEVEATTEELATFFNAFNQASDGPGVGEAMREGIRFLRRALEAVAPGTVVLLAIL
jgi:hypothetical protein